MRQYRLVMFSIFLFILTLSTVYSKSLPLLGKVIYIDPGHGGKDPGAIYKDLKESDLNLIYSKAIGQFHDANLAPLLSQSIIPWVLGTE